MTGALDSPREGGARLSHRDVLLIAGPITLSNATTPLVGFVDTIVIGQSGEAALIGALAVASNVFNFLYWLFAFLRMGTTGFAAQAAGARDGAEVAATLYRALLVAAGFGLVLVLAQAPIADAGFWLMGASGAVEAAARTYYDIRIWGAPAALANFALVGWFIGLGRAGTAFWLQLVLNVINLALAVLLVLVFDFGVAGVGYAALVAELVAAAVGLAIARGEVRRRGGAVSRALLLDAERLTRLLAVNTDIMIRTFCVLAAFSFFTAQGARAGDLTLAANAILHGMAMIAVYLLDGFAYAAETLVGQAIGARDRERYRRAVWLATLWGAAFGLLLTLLLVVGGPLMVAAATPAGAVRTEAMDYLFWVALTPILGVWCFLLDGIFIGATRTADMRNMMILSLLVYFAAFALLQPAFGNHGLWAALMVFYVVRALLLWWRLPALERAAFAEPPVAAAAPSR